jgi:hypothetical protein
MNSTHNLFIAATSVLAGAILTAVLLFTAVPRLHAEDLDRCQRRVAHAEHELHESIEKHGRNSKQANHERRELHSARERCWREGIGGGMNTSTAGTTTATGTSTTTTSYFPSQKYAF